MFRLKRVPQVMYIQLPLIKAVVQFTLLYKRFHTHCEIVHLKKLQKFIELYEICNVYQVVEVEGAWGMEFLLGRGYCFL